MSTSEMFLPAEKKISSCVRPGVLDVRASALRPVSALIRLDLPTFERPASAISAARTPTCSGACSRLRPASPDPGMIATSRFVHLHLHKSGGTFVNECLLRFFPDARQLGYHLPRSRLPPELATLPLLGFVRNPWSYYVSWFEFQSRRPQPNALFRRMSADGTLDFNATVRNLVRLGDSELLDDVLAQLPAAYTNHGLNLPAFALAPIRGSGLGFYSYLYDYMYGGADGRRQRGGVAS